MPTFFKILLALLQLVAIGARYAAKRDQSLKGRQEIMLSLFKRISEQVDAAIKAGHDFDAELHADPDGLLVNDGFKRQTNKIRDSTANRS